MRPEMDNDIKFELIVFVSETIENLNNQIPEHATAQEVRKFLDENKPNLVCPDALGYGWYPEMIPLYQNYANRRWNIEIEILLRRRFEKGSVKYFEYEDELLTSHAFN